MNERKRLPDTRASIIHKVKIEGSKIYITVGLYEDETPGELFVTIGKEGSTMGGFMDSFGIAISMLLQTGWSVDMLANKFKDCQFEPRGRTDNPNIPVAKSIIDYIFRWMQNRWGENEQTKTISS